MQRPLGPPVAWPEGTTPHPTAGWPSRAAWRFSSIEVRQRPSWCPIRSGRLLDRSGRWNHDPTAASVVELRCWGRSAAAPTASAQTTPPVETELSVDPPAAAPRWICASAARWTGALRSLKQADAATRASLAGTGTQHCDCWWRPKARSRALQLQLAADQRGLHCPSSNGDGILTLAVVNRVLPDGEQLQLKRRDETWLPRHRSCPPSIRVEPLGMAGVCVGEQRWIRQEAVWLRAACQAISSKNPAIHLHPALDHSAG